MHAIPEYMDENLIDYYKLHIRKKFKDSDRISLQAQLQPTSPKIQT